MQIDEPQNLLYANPSDDAPIKLADFGLAKLFDPSADDGGLHTT
jgi:serine/threonine protein kinase